MSAPTDLENCSFTQFADAFLTLHRQGKRLTIDQAIEAFPHLEDEIRAQLPAMMLLDNAIGEVDYTEPRITDGQPIEGCVLKEEIGRGASGVVYRAYQPDLDREVAVKITRLVPEHSARFETERQAMARLEHPNIVPVYSYACVDSQAYLIMKLIDGYSISELLGGECDHHGKFLLNHLRDDWIDFAKLGADLASGLRHAHERNLIHRDIKPSNVLLDREGHVWITDFGLVKTLDATRSLTATGDLVGTPKYMAPEQLRGHCDPRSDIYALGLTLYELATGQKLQKVDSVTKQPSANEKPELAMECKDVPDSLMHIIRKASAFDPEDRYQSASEMNTVLRRFIDKKVPDRRKQRRKPDEVYHREYRKKLIAAIIVSILGCSSFYMIFRTWRSTPKNTPAPPHA